MNTPHPSAVLEEIERLDREAKNGCSEMQKALQTSLAFNSTHAPSLARALKLAVEALQYCSIEPGRLHPQNQMQHVRALSALAALAKEMGGE